MRSLFLAALLYSSVAHAVDPPKVDPGKPVSVTLPVQDWQTVLASVGDSDRLTARDANRISRTVVSQIQLQLQGAAVQKK